MRHVFALITISLLLCPTLSHAQSTFNYNDWQTRHNAAKGEKAKESSFSDNILKSTCVFANGFIQAGSMHGPGLTIGGYINNINIEASYIYGLTESYQVERIFGDSHHAFTYKPQYFGGKVGYGIDFRGCLRFTPQIGVGVLRIDGLQANENSTRNKENAIATIISGGVKVFFAFHKNFGIFVTPEYQSKIANGEIYDRFTDKTGVYVSPNSSTKEIENWTKGFRARIGLEIVL